MTQFTHPLNLSPKPETLSLLVPKAEKADAKAEESPQASLQVLRVLGFGVCQFGAPGWDGLDLLF